MRTSSQWDHAFSGTGDVALKFAPELVLRIPLFYLSFPRHMFVCMFFPVQPNLQKRALSIISSTRSSEKKDIYFREDLFRNEPEKLFHLRYDISRY